jgi:hypothetical protein
MGLESLLRELSFPQNLLVSFAYTKFDDYTAMILQGRSSKSAQPRSSNWLPPRDSNPDMLIQSQLSYH